MQINKTLLFFREKNDLINVQGVKSELSSKRTFKVSHNIRKSKTVLDSGFYAADSRLRYSIPVSDSGTWILDSNRQWDSGFLELYSGFQRPGFRIPQSLIWVEKCESSFKRTNIVQRLGVIGGLTPAPR